VRSQIVTIMAPDDEAAFLRFVFERPTTHLIPEVRNPTREVPRTRDVHGKRSLHCMLWDEAILPEPVVEHVPSCKDYYLRSEESLIQFLRSPVARDTLSAGRIALATGWRGGTDTDPKTARAMTLWYNTLARWIKSNFENSFVYASDFKPEVGSRERMVWVGPRAIEMSLHGTKLKHNGPPEYSLHYFDLADEERVLSRYRAPRNLIAVGRVTNVGDVVDGRMAQQMFRVALDDGAPFAEFEGSFSTVNPKPKLGDEVACVFNENIFGRHSAPWEPREIRKLTPAGRQRVLQSLRKVWRL
jgi:hypothetical protein